MSNGPVPTPEAWLSAIRPQDGRLLDFVSTNQHYCAAFATPLQTVQIHVELMANGKDAPGPIFTEIVKTATDRESFAADSMLERPKTDVTLFGNRIIVTVRLTSNFQGGMNIKIHYGPSDSDFAECKVQL